MICDDDLPEAFNKWIANLDADVWLDLCEKFADAQIARVNNKLKIETAEEWFAQYHCDHIANSGVDEDALYEQWRDMQNETTR